MSNLSALARLRATRHGAPAAVIVVFFVASRAAAYAAGLRFDSSPLGRFWQIVDPELLRTRLAESLFYLHSQPPLFNLYLGGLLKAFGGHYATVAQAMYLVLGMVGALALYGLLDALGCRRWIGVAVTVLMTGAPATILYESWLFYEQPVAMFLVLSAFALAAFLRTQSFWPGFFFFLLLAAVVLMRSTFQMVWMLLATALVLVALRQRKRVVLRACLVPLLLVASLYAKNAAVFGVASTSSWFGMSLAEKMNSAVSPAERARRVGRGELSRVSLARPFGPLEVYRGLAPRSRPTGIPVLDEPTLLGGTPNFNNKSYVRISDLYLGDALHLIREEPSAYARSIVNALELAFQPSSDYGRGWTEGKPVFRSYYNGFNRFFYLQTRYAAVGLTILGAYTLALLYGLRVLHLWLRGGSRSDPRLVMLLYLWLTVLYLSLVIALVSFLEAYRIRFEVDLLVTPLVVCALRDAWGALGGRLRARVAERGA